VLLSVSEIVGVSLADVTIHPYPAPEQPKRLAMFNSNRRGFLKSSATAAAASPHVTDPCGTFGRRTEWFQEPVKFWRQQRAWENVLKKHPRMVVVNAHMLWLCYSDEQLDCLRYMLSTYPNLNVDLATTAVFLHAVGRDNLRSFMIEYADRILFGTDMASQWFVPVLDKQFPRFATRYRSTSGTSICWRPTRSYPAVSRTNASSAAWPCPRKSWRKSTSATPCASTPTSPRR
jgi:hypothetical protein